MSSPDIIQKAAQYVKSKQSGFKEAGHDWFHTLRVWKMAVRLAEQIKCDLTVVHLASLFHDIADAKFTGGEEMDGPAIAREWMQKEKIDPEIIEKVAHIIANISWRKQHTAVLAKNPEFAIVQDADRLDAIGAIGIARAFSYGGFKSRPIFIPTSERNEFDPNNDTISHFYEKLLLLKETLNTAPAREIARERHQFMIAFLNQFNREQNC